MGSTVLSSSTSWEIFPLIASRFLFEAFSFLLMVKTNCYTYNVMLIFQAFWMNWNWHLIKTIRLTFLSRFFSLPDNGFFGLLSNSSAIPGCSLTIPSLVRSVLFSDLCSAFVRSDRSSDILNQAGSFEKSFFGLTDE